MTKESPPLTFESLQQRTTRLDEVIKRVSVVSENLGTPTGSKRFNIEARLEEARQRGQIPDGLEGIYKTAKVRRRVIEQDLPLIPKIQEAIRTKTLPALEKRVETTRAQIARWPEEMRPMETMFLEIKKSYQESKDTPLPIVTPEEYEQAKLFYGQKVAEFLGRINDVKQEKAGEKDLGQTEQPKSRITLSRILYPEDFTHRKPDRTTAYLPQEEREKK